MDQKIICRTIKGGVQAWTGIPKPDHDKIISDIEAKSCRIFELSSNGRYLACCGSKGVKICNVSDWKIMVEIPLEKIAGAKFSPSENYISLWEPYAVTPEHPQGFDNLRIYKIPCGSLVKAYVQKRNAGWEPTWSRDDQLMARNLNGDVHFFEKENFACITHKIEGQKIRSVSISPGPIPYHVLCYTPGIKGQPSFSRIFKFPNLENAVASRSLFQGEDIEIRWNKTGKEVLIMASTEVDKSGASYYGKNALFYLDTRGNSAVVQLDKQGPIYAHEFTPDGKGFCVVYGFMPSVCKLFDSKCDIIHDYGPGYRNSIYYNPHGNLLMLGGFGNISGQMEIWDVKGHKKIFKAEIPDVTYLCWAADGEHFIAGTTAPRLRVNNGFKIWHYTGSLQFEFKVQEGDELYQVALQPIPEGVFPAKEIVTKQVPGIEYATKQDAKKAYVPPGARNRPASDLSTRTQFGVYTKSSYLPPGLVLPAQPSGASASGKNKQRTSRNFHNQDTEKGVKTGLQSSLKTDSKLVPEILKDDVERKKRISNLNKKLEQIVKLKERVAVGETLEINQKEKIQKEEEIRRELKLLTLS